MGKNASAVRDTLISRSIPVNVPRAIAVSATSRGPGGRVPCRAVSVSVARVSGDVPSPQPPTSAIRASPASSVETGRERTTTGGRKRCPPCGPCRPACTIGTSVNMIGPASECALMLAQVHTAMGPAGERGRGARLALGAVPASFPHRPGGLGQPWSLRLAAKEQFDTDAPPVSVQRGHTVTAPDRGGS